MIYLFSKEHCKKCSYIKEHCDLSGVTQHDVQTIEGLALLAWFELVGLAETQLPILLVTDKHDREIVRITGAIKIKKYLKEQSDKGGM